jgi:O-antigen/teichoic acid export membrane protein
VRSNSSGVRLFTEGGIYTLGLFVMRAGNFLLIPLYLNILDPESYGAFGIVKQVVNVLVILAVASQGHALLRLGVDIEHDDSAIARLVSSVFTYVSAASLVLAGAVALIWPLLS